MKRKVAPSWKGDQWPPTTCLAVLAYSKSRREDLRLSKGSEDGHQHLIFKVICPANGHVQDVDGLLLDILETTTAQVQS